MTLDTVIMLFGAFVAVLPFLQFPPSWVTALSFIAGIIIVGLGIAVRRRGLRRAPGISEARSPRDLESKRRSEDEHGE